MVPIAISPIEERVLRIVARSPARLCLADEIARDAQMEVAHTLSAIGFLLAKGLLAEEVGEELVTWRLAPAGKRYVSMDALPEETIWRAIADAGGMSANQLFARYERSDVKYALHALRFESALTNEGEVLSVASAQPPRDRELLDVLRAVSEHRDIDPASSPAMRAKARRLIQEKKSRLRRYRVTPHGTALAGRLETDTERVLSMVTPPLLAIERRHPLIRLTQYVRTALEGEGFQEVPAEIVDSELWNSDVLFVPTYHNLRRRHTLVSGRSGRSAHDAVIAERFHDELNGTGTSGSRGWYDATEILHDRTVLRSNGTASVVKWLGSSRRQSASVFAMSRCFRSHWKRREFFQVDLLFADPRLTLADLFGVVRRVVRALRRSDDQPQLEPAHFPFATGAVSIVVPSPRGGPTTLGAAGLLRPEPLAILGVETRVGLIGFQLERLAQELIHVASDRAKPWSSRDAGLLSRIPPSEFASFRVGRDG